MTNLSEEEYKKIRKRVKKRFEQRTELASHLIAYAFINIAFHAWWGWGVLPATIISVSWGMGLAIHATQVIFETGHLGSSARTRCST